MRISHSIKATACRLAGSCIKETAVLLCLQRSHAKYLCNLPVPQLSSRALRENGPRTHAAVRSKRAVAGQYRLAVVEVSLCSV